MYANVVSIHGRSRVMERLSAEGIVEKAAR